MNETRITAYALNELPGGERDRFESDLASDQNLQSELASASRVADGLAQVMSEPGEGLEPEAREKLLRAIGQNQEALRQRRKILRLAMPVSLAAAASIAVLLWVAGGMTTQQPAVAADGEGAPMSAPARPEMAGGSGNGLPSDSGPFSARTIRLSESARAAQQMREQGSLSLTSPLVRTKTLLWNDGLPMWGDSDHNR